jgi:hypothetical protein
MSGAGLSSDPRAGASPAAIAGALALSAPTPNPSWGSARVQLTVPAGETVRHWSVFDTAGRRLWSSSEQRWAPGTQELVWPGRDERGAAVPPGVYLMSAFTDRGTVTRRLLRTR